MRIRHPSGATAELKPVRGIPCLFLKTYSSLEKLQDYAKRVLNDEGLRSPFLLVLTPQGDVLIDLDTISSPSGLESTLPDQLRRLLTELNAEASVCSGIVIGTQCIMATKQRGEPPKVEI